MNGDQWSAVGLVLYVVIMAAVVLVMTVIFRTSDLRRDFADGQREDVDPVAVVWAAHLGWVFASGEVGGDERKGHKGSRGAAQFLKLNSR